jgi:hypothetical protein
LKEGTPANPTGGEAVVDFSFTVVSKNLNQGKYTPKLLANTCYHYETRANPEVCIQPDMLKATLSKSAPVCRPSDISLGTQGAPVAVKKIEQTTLPNEIQFKITIQNVGKGEIVDPTASCTTLGSSQLTRQQLDRVVVKSIKVGEKELQCRPLDSSKIMRLIDGVGYIICTLPLTDAKNTPSYVTPLAIHLAYDYKQSIEKQITINKITSSSDHSSKEGDGFFWP